MPHEGPVAAVPPPTIGGRGLVATALGSGTVAAITLAFAILEAVSIAAGVTAIAAGGASWIRTRPGQHALRAAATVGLMLGTLALVTTIRHVDKTIIPVDQRQIEQRR